MKNVHITKESKSSIVEALDVAIDADKQYQVSITVRDNSLKGRQRRLARVWYEAISKHSGESVTYCEAQCKLLFGLHLITKDDEELEVIVRSMLGDRIHEEKIKIIEKHYSWFPLLRDDGGLSVEDTAEYLNRMVVGFASDLELISSNEEKMLFCREAHN